MKKPLLLALPLLLLFSCAEEKQEISAVKINSITVIDYPITQGATAWDDPFIGSATPPDITWRITGAQNLDGGIYFPDVAGETLLFDNDQFPLFLDSPTRTYTLSLWDVDDLDSSDLGSEDDQMASINFVPFSEGAEGTETLEISSGGATIQLNVTYVFE